MAENRAVGVKVSLKSKPGRWLKPLATRRALYRSMEPSAVCFTLKTHLDPIALRPAGKSASSQVPFCEWASISSSAAFVHCTASGFIGFFIVYHIFFGLLFIF